MHIVSLVLQSVLLWLFGAFILVALISVVPKVALIDQWDEPYRATLLEVWKASAPDSFECDGPTDFTLRHCSQLATFWDSLRFSSAGETEVYVRIWTVIWSCLGLFVFVGASASSAWQENKGILTAGHRMPTWALLALLVPTALAFSFIVEDLAL